MVKLPLPNIHKYEHERMLQETLSKECSLLAHLPFQDNACQLSKLLQETYLQDQSHMLMIKEEPQYMNKQKISHQPSSRIQKHFRLKFQTF